MQNQQRAAFSPVEKLIRKIVLLLGESRLPNSSQRSGDYSPDWHEDYSFNLLSHYSPIAPDWSELLQLTNDATRSGQTEIKFAVFLDFRSFNPDKYRVLMRNARGVPKPADRLPAGIILEEWTIFVAPKQKTISTAIINPLIEQIAAITLCRSLVSILATLPCHRLRHPPNYSGKNPESMVGQSTITPPLGITSPMFKSILGILSLDDSVLSKGLDEEDAFEPTAELSLPAIVIQDTEISINVCYRRNCQLIIDYIGTGPTAIQASPRDIHAPRTASVPLAGSQGFERSGSLQELKSVSRHSSFENVELEARFAQPIASSSSVTNSLPARIQPSSLPKSTSAIAGDIEPLTRSISNTSIGSARRIPLAGVRQSSIARSPQQSFPNLHLSTSTGSSLGKSPVRTLSMPTMTSTRPTTSPLVEQPPLPIPPRASMTGSQRSSTSGSLRRSSLKEDGILVKLMKEFDNPRVFTQEELNQCQLKHRPSEYEKRQLYYKVQSMVPELEAFLRERRESQTVEQPVSVPANMSQTASSLSASLSSYRTRAPLISPLIEDYNRETAIPQTDNDSDTLRDPGSSSTIFKFHD